MPSFQAAKDAGDISRLAVAEEEEAGQHRDGEEAELELGLSLGGKIATSGRTLRSGGARLLWGDCCRILTAEDFPPILASQGSPISSSSSTASSSPSVGRGHRGGCSGAAGNKRTADFVAPNVGSQRPSGQVVGWPPVRTYRMNSVINHSKDSSEGNNNEKDCSNGASRCKITGHAVNIPRSATKEMGSHQQQAKKGPIGGSLFVKVNMDGMPIGRKVDLNSHHTYEALAMALEEMFQSRDSVDRSIRTWKKANLLDGSSGFVLTYEDKDGDWMLVGDVPWGGIPVNASPTRMFLSTVQRLRIMRVPDVRGLVPLGSLTLLDTLYSEKFVLTIMRPWLPTGGLTGLRPLEVIGSRNNRDLAHRTSSSA